MKKILLFPSVCLTVNICFGQLEFKTSLMGRVVEMTDQNGHSLLKKYDPDITGSPFINTDWVPATITLSKGKEIGPIPVKLNIESNELYFRDSTGKELIALEGLVKKIDCLNFYSRDSIRYVFKNGYPGIDKQNENYYYQVFTEGKIELLAKRFRYIRTVKDELSGEMTKEFVEGVTVLYVYAYGIMQAFHPNKSFVISLLEGKEQAMNTFISTHKINFKKIPDLIKLFNYYEGLQ
jgi:hypothetical protein